MAKAVFLTTMEPGDGKPVLLPDIAEGNGTQIFEELPDGSYRDGSGWSVIGEAPLPNTVLVLVDTSPETMAVMKKDTEKYFHLEDIPEDEKTNISA